MLRMREADLQAQLHATRGDAELHAELAEQHVRLQRETARAVRGRHRAVAQLRAAEAAAGRYDHRNLDDGWVRIGSARRAADPYAGRRVHGASQLTLSSRALSHRGRAVYAYLTTTITTTAFAASRTPRGRRMRQVLSETPEAARQREHVVAIREQHLHAKRVRLRAIALRRGIDRLRARTLAHRAGSEWDQLDRAHQQWLLAMCAWYEAGAPHGREPGVHVPAVDWLARTEHGGAPRSSPSRTPPPRPITLPYGPRAASLRMGARCEDAGRAALVPSPAGVPPGASIEHLNRQYHQDMSRARLAQPEDRYWAEQRASGRLSDRYQLRLAIRDLGLEGTNPISPLSPRGTIELLPPHDIIPSTSELLMFEDRLDDAQWTLEELSRLRPGYDPQALTLHTQLRLWLRAVHELMQHASYSASHRVCTLSIAPLDTRALSIPRHAMWRHVELVDSMLSSIEAMLDTMAHCMPTAASLVSRFEAWESLPQHVARETDRDLIMPPTEQLREARSDQAMQDRRLHQQLVTGYRRHGTMGAAPPEDRVMPTRALAAGSPDGTGMTYAHVSLVEACMTTIATGWDSVLRLFCLHI